MDSLETARLRLRQWREADFDAFARYYADAETARFVGGFLPLPLGLAWVARGTPDAASSM